MNMYSVDHASHGIQLLKNRAAFISVVTPVGVALITGIVIRDALIICMMVMVVIMVIVVVSRESKSMIVVTAHTSPIMTTTNTALYKDNRFLSRYIYI